MTSDARTILREALLLDQGDRVGIAAELLASLDAAADQDEAAIAQAWAEELDRRAARVLSGDESAEAWNVVRDRALDDLSR